MDSQAIKKSPSPIATIRRRGQKLSVGRQGLPAESSAKAAGLPHYGLLYSPSPPLVTGERALMLSVRGGYSM